LTLAGRPATVIRVDSSASARLVEGADARPRDWRRLVKPVLLLLVGSALVAGAARGWAAIQPDHDVAHGTPAQPAALEKAMLGPFAAPGSGWVAVLDASCVGQGEATAAGFTHFTCRLVFDDGAREEVVVHLLERDELFFKSSVGTTR
jgi:hypothetical protein